jgi:hypothetical protein
MLQMTPSEIRDALRDGTLVFCMAAAHDEFTAEFLDDFSERILKRDWRELSMASNEATPSLLDDEDSEEDLVAAIQSTYGADVSDLPGLPLWDVMRRCARTATHRHHAG